MSDCGAPPSVRQAGPGSGCLARATLLRLDPVELVAGIMAFHGLPRAAAARLMVDALFDEAAEGAALRAWQACKLTREAAAST